MCACMCESLEDLEGLESLEGLEIFLSSLVARLQSAQKHIVEALQPRPATNNV